MRSSVGRHYHSVYIENAGLEASGKKAWADKTSICQAAHSSLSLPSIEVHHAAQRFSRARLEFRAKGIGHRDHCNLGSLGKRDLQNFGNFTFVS